MAEMVSYTATVTYAGNASTWTTWTSTTNSSVGDEWTGTGTSTTTVWEGSWSRDRSSLQEQRKQRLRDRRQQEEIQAKAKRMLFRLLNDEEQVEFRRYGSIRVRGKDHIYEIGEASESVTVLTKDGEPLHNLCLHPPLSYPKLDRLAATLLALRCDEEIVKRGNRNALTEHMKRRIVARRNHKEAA